MKEERLTFTVAETARLLGIARNTAYDRVRTGEIPVLRLGRRLLVPKRALERLLEESSFPQRQASSSSFGGCQ